MGRAERAAAAREREKVRIQAAQDRQEERRARDELAVRLERIESLRLQALKVLKSQDWPNGTLIKPYGSFYKRKKAGWKAGSIVTHMHGQAGSRPIYLLSNGRWSAPGDFEVTTAELLQKRRTIGIEEGLQRIIGEYRV